MSEKTPEQKERDDARNAAIRNAKDQLRAFFANKLFSKLPENIQDALKTLAPSGRVATNTLANEIRDLFGDRTVLTELDIFKALKVGPNEFKAKVNHCLKTAQPEDRMWISYDPQECTWTFIAVGPMMPEDFRTDNLIPSVLEATGHPDFDMQTVVQLIAAGKNTIEPVPPVTEG